MKKIKYNYGFTLLEMLLVMVITATILVMTTSYMTQKADTMRMDKTVQQVQSILNAGLAYYVANGKWPGNNNTWYQLNGSGSTALPQKFGGNNDTMLQPDYLGRLPMLDMSGEAIWYIHDGGGSASAPSTSFQVWTCVPGSAAVSSARAKMLAGNLPLALTEPGDVSCSTLYTVAYVIIPGQDLNNASAVNFAGLYHHGACVPVPTCPTSNGVVTTPQVFVVPVSVSGINDTNNPQNVYPISSFTAYAKGNNPLNNSPPACSSSSTNTPTCPTSDPYWRVCLHVITERGAVDPGGPNDWGKNVTVSAFTRCSIQNEPSGSNLGVYGN